MNLPDFVQDVVKVLLVTKDPAEKAAIIADHILSTLPENVTFVANRCIMFHWFDQSVIEALLKEFDLTQDEIRNVYEQLEALPFIEKVPWGLTFQDLTREGLLRRYGSKPPDWLKSAALQAALVYRNHTDDKVIAEAAFCYVLANSKQLGEQLTDKLTKQAQERGDPQFVENLQSLLDEARQMPFVRSSLLDQDLTHAFDTDETTKNVGTSSVISMNGSRREKHYFISYSHKDLDIARQIKEDLKKRDFEIWMDEANISPGTDWEDALRESIRQSIAVLYLVSPTSRRSPRVRHEIELATTYKRRIFPLWIGGDTEWADVVIFGYSSIQHIDLRGELYTPGIGRLALTLNNLSDSDTRKHEEGNTSVSLQEVETTESRSLTLQVSHEEREMQKDSNKIGQLQPAEARIIHVLRELVVTILYLGLVIFRLKKQPGEFSPRPNNQKSGGSASVVLNPYKGLHAFEYEDAVDFFGRERLVDEMIQHVNKLLSEEKQNSQVSRCMMVVGASGSGKSSVVMAGLLPALEKRKNIPEVKRWFFLKPLRPGEDPMNALAQTLKLSFLNEEKVGLSPLKRWKQANLRKTLDEPDSGGLSELLRQITDNRDERIVLIVDQFEEIFAPAVKPEQREQFINLLTATATEPNTPILLLFTLRADFYDRILDDNALYEKVEHHLINIPPMTREELRAVIEKPAQHSKVTFDPDLAEDLLYEVLQRPESLPLLQFTLEQLFKLRDRTGRRLTRQSYDEIEGLRGAINKHANTTYYALQTPLHRAEAQKLFTEYFIYVVEAHDESSHFESGEGITRRRVTQSELKLDDPRSSIRRETINAFVKARLLTATSTVIRTGDLEQDNTPNITYEISHEALISAWERFRQWIKEDRKDIYLLQSLRQRIRQWDQETSPQKKKDLLVEKLDLQQLQDCSQRKTLESPADKFLQASLDKQKRQKVRGYFLLVGITALVILSLVLGLFIRNVLSPPDPTIVTSLADVGPGTLPYVVQRAGDGATITFDAHLSGQTISLTHSGLDINKSLTIHGPAGGISISSSNTGNYIAIEASHNVTLDNMTFTNSYPLKHSMIENAGNLTINRSNLTKNKSYTSNGGGAIDNKGTLILNNDTIAQNTVNSDGGAIYNLFGTVSINNSTIRDNEAYYNGGGIYSEGGVVIVNGSHIVNNRADSNAGGGIEMVNGSLSMNDTRIDQNHSDSMSGDVGEGIGGGLAIVGSVAFINTSVITDNTASMKGGGIAVTDDTDNNSSSLVKLQDIIQTDPPRAIHVGQNSGGDIAGHVTATGTTLQILDDTSVDNLGDPPGSYLPQKFPNYLGIANINGFCLNKGDSYGKISTKVDKSLTDIMFTCFDQNNQVAGPDISGQTICQSQYSVSPGVDTVIDRMVNYYDPTSLQCYKNLNRLGPIGKSGFNTYCASQPQYTGIFDNPRDRQTAYDWLCQPKDTSKLPTGFSVLDACNIQYHTTNAIDRLANFNSVDGLECWEPA